MHKFRDLREKTGMQSYIGVMFIGHTAAPSGLIKSPKVREFCKRLIKLGFIADLEMTSDFPPKKELLEVGVEASIVVSEREEPPEELRTASSAILGAAEIWAISEGMAVKPGWKEVPKDRVREFTDEVMPRSERTADAILARPWPPQDSPNN
jgi:hypothetical protein